MNHINFAVVSKFDVVHAGACYTQQTSPAGYGSASARSWARQIEALHRHMLGLPSPHETTRVFW